MGVSPYSLELRFEFIKDFYKSGLFIPAWCHDNKIAPGTFYGWIKQVTSHGYEIPDSLNYHPAVKRQEVVKLPIIDDIYADSYINDFPSFNDTDEDKPLVLSAHIGDITLDIPHDIDQDFLTKIFKSFKECL
uniref:hypothetical protein n=1 Tax=Lachnospira eligens TaxID=39485 RepID=UPI003FEE126E